MGLFLELARKLECWSEAPGKNASGEPAPDTPLKLFAQCLALPNSPLDRQSVIGFPLNVRNAG
jgi:hypothetical protein